MVLGNFSIDEILYGTAQDSNDELLYTLDQLSTAEISIEAESTDITDKKGNVVRTVYTSKTGTFTATNAFLHPQIMNAASGSEIEKASSSNPIEMPFITVVAAGEPVKVEGAKIGTLKVIGLYGNGANDDAIDVEGSGKPSWATLVADSSDPTVYDNTSQLVLPAPSATTPIEYLIKYDRNVQDGIKLVNDAESFPDLVKLTLFCSYVDPCSDDLKPCYVVIPRFMADPSVTISLDRESQEMDFNGNLNIDYCSTTKALYYIYFPTDEL